MDKDQAFKEVQNNISNGNYDIVGPQVMQIALEFKDPPTLLTCISLLKVIGDTERTNEIVGLLFSDLSDNGFTRLEVAKGLKGLGLFEDSLKILEMLQPDDDINRELMSVYYSIGNYESSIKAYGNINETTIKDDIVVIDAYCSSKDLSTAQKKSEELLVSDPSDYDVRKCYVSVLFHCGKQKDAEKYVKGILKSEKNSADAIALAGYYMWMNGKISAAGGYAIKAIKIDDKHVGAMEILAFCLIEKGKTDEARIVAGAINEQVPGHQAVMRIVDACRQ